jgi:hypothetical protein
LAINWQSEMDKRYNRVGYLGFEIDDDVCNHHLGVELDVDAGVVRQQSTRNFRWDEQTTTEEPFVVRIGGTGQDQTGTRTAGT